MRSDVGEQALTLLGRALRKLCPACGTAPIFERRFVVRRSCPGCGYELGRRQDDTFFFMYASTAVLTGVFILAMFAYRPENPWLGRAVVAVSAVTLYGATHDVRKSLAFAIDYWFEQRLG